jgi:hypothetical protein
LPHPPSQTKAPQGSNSPRRSEHGKQIPPKGEKGDAIHFERSGHVTFLQTHSETKRPVAARFSFAMLPNNQQEIRRILSPSIVHLVYLYHSPPVL